MVLVLFSISVGAGWAKKGKDRVVYTATTTKCPSLGRGRRFVVVVTEDGQKRRRLLDIGIIVIPTFFGHNDGHLRVKVLQGLRRSGHSWLRLATAIQNGCQGETRGQSGSQDGAEHEKDREELGSNHGG